MTLSTLLLADLVRTSQRYPEIDFQPILVTQKELLNKIESQGRASTLKKIDELYNLKPVKVDLITKEASVRFSGEVNSDFNKKLVIVLEELKAWRKGPFNFFGTKLDAEWRADLKFSRLGLSDLTGRKVVDVGAGNGYYLYRLLALNPELVFGIDPTDRYLLQYYLLRTLSKEELPLGYVLDRDSLLRRFRRFFDLVICMGVFYHHPRPEILLENLFYSTSVGGELYLETLFFDNKSIYFKGKNRYAKMKNVYLIPNELDLIKLLEKAGFGDVEIVSRLTVESSEQRATLWAPGSSLSDFLNPDYPAHTVEGLPRPKRITIRAKRLDL